MANEWMKLCSGKGFCIDRNDIVVEFGERKHRVRITDDGDTYRLTSAVTSRNLEGHIEDLAIRLWMRNRSTQLVGFRLDERRRVVGESWAPKAGLSSDEFMMQVRHVAAACDRLEYLLTGQDEVR